MTVQHALRRLRIHPCAPGFLTYAAMFVAAVVIAGSSPVLGLAFAAPALVIALSYGQVIAQGHPQSDARAADRLACALRALHAPEEVRSVVQTQMPVGIFHRHRPAPTVFAALSFVEQHDDDVLRGAAALQLAAVQNHSCFTHARRWRWSGYGVVLAAAIAADLLVPAHDTLAGYASIALTVWLLTLIASIWSRSEACDRAFWPDDDSAVRLTGDPVVVERALLALAEWRAQAAARRSPLGRVIATCRYPVRPDWHEISRARRLAAIR